MAITPGVIQTAITMGAQLQVLIQSYLSMPVLQASLLQTSLVPSVWTAGGVRIEPLTYRTEYSADISEQLLININGGKEFLTDNIAARPRTWKITGYIPGSLISDVLSQAASVDGSVVPQVLNPLLGQLTMATDMFNAFMPSLKERQKYLEALFYGRQTFQFKTRDNEYIQNAVMSSLIIERKAESQNKLNIDVTIREINILSSTSLSSASVPVSGSSSNVDPNDLGSTTSTSVVTPAIASQYHGVAVGTPINK